MARKQSAGTLLHRAAGEGDGVAVLIVHPSGNYNRRAPWSIPKGLPDEGETREDAARRETEEETGVVVTGELVALGYIDYQKSRKRIFAFTGLAPEDAAPHCASWEVDRAEFVPLEEARDKLHPDQGPFLDRLLRHLAGEDVGSPDDPGSSGEREAD